MRGSVSLEMVAGAIRVAHQKGVASGIITDYVRAAGLVWDPTAGTVRKNDLD